MAGRLSAGPLILPEGMAPANPAAGRRLLYPKSDGWYEKDSSGNEYRVGENPGGALGQLEFKKSATDYDMNWAYPYNSPSEYGLVGYNFPPDFCGTSGNALGAGVVTIFKCYTPVPISITNLHVAVTTAGATLTSGQNFAALYDASKNKVGTSADQTTAWQSIGFKTMALVGGPYAVPVGNYYIVVWSNGTTRPTLARSTSLNVANGNLSTANSKYATSGTATTTGPATLGAFSAATQAIWVGAS